MPYALDNFLRVLRCGSLLGLSNDETADRVRFILTAIWVIVYCGLIFDIDKRLTAIIYYDCPLTFVKMHHTTYSSAAIADIINYQDDIRDSFRWGPETLKDLTTDVWDYSFGFVRVGLAADLIRSRKLWNQSKLYLDWKDYCVKALGKTAWSINRTIDAANVVMRLIEFGHKTLPTCEAQCRPLVPMMRNMY